MRPTLRDKVMKAFKNWAWDMRAQNVSPFLLSPPARRGTHSKGSSCFPKQERSLSEKRIEHGHLSSTCTELWCSTTRDVSLRHAGSLQKHWSHFKHSTYGVRRFWRNSSWPGLRSAPKT